VYIEWLDESGGDEAEWDFNNEIGALRKWLLSPLIGLNNFLPAICRALLSIFSRFNV
jgi:hypothetical protein